MPADLQTFARQGHARVEVLSGRLLALTRTPGDPAALQDLLQGIRALRAGGGPFPALRHFLEVAHATEDVLAALQDGSVRFAPGYGDALFASLDLLTGLLDEPIGHPSADPALAGDAERIVTLLRELLARELLADEPAAALLRPPTSAPLGVTVPDRREALPDSTRAPAWTQQRGGTRAHSERIGPPCAEALDFTVGPAAGLAVAPAIAADWHARISVLAEQLAMARNGLPALATQAITGRNPREVARQIDAHGRELAAILQAMDAVLRPAGAPRALHNGGDPAESLEFLVLVESAQQRFGLRGDAIVERLTIPDTAIHTLRQRRSTVLNGRVLPLVTLADLLRIDAAPSPEVHGLWTVAVARTGAEYVGIVVDACLEPRHLPVRPLLEPLAHAPGCRALAQLADGATLPVLDLQTLLS